MLPDYLEKLVNEKAQEIINGFEITKSIVPTLTKQQYGEQLRKDYIQIVGYTNGLRPMDIEDHHRVKLLSAKRALDYFEKDNKS